MTSFQKRARLEENPTSEKTPPFLTSEINPEEITIEDFPYSGRFLFERCLDNLKQGLETALGIASFHKCMICNDSSKVPTSFSDPFGDMDKFPLKLFKNETKFMCVTCASQFKQYIAYEKMFDSYKTCFTLHILDEEERIELLKTKDELSRHCFQCGSDDLKRKEEQICFGDRCGGSPIGKHTTYLCKACAIVKKHTGLRLGNLCYICKDDALKDSETLYNFQRSIGKPFIAVDFPYRYMESADGIDAVGTQICLSRTEFVNSPLCKDLDKLIRNEFTNAKSLIEE